jgi:hypothetical protein
MDHTSNLHYIQLHLMGHHVFSGMQVMDQIILLTKELLQEITA